MAEKTIPWWRKALNFALGGLRSGFGLFSRTAEPEAVSEVKSPSSQQKNQEEESALIEPPPQPEIVAAAVAIPIEPVTEPITEPVAEAVSVIEAEPEVATAMPIHLDAPIDPISALPELVITEAIAPLSPAVETIPAPVKETEAEVIVKTEPEVAETIEAEAVIESVPELVEEAEAVVEAEPVNDPLPKPVEKVDEKQMPQNESRALASEEHPSPVAAEQVAEAETAIVPLPVPLEVAEAVAEPEPQPVPEPLLAPDAEPPLVLTPQPTAEEAANEIADEKAAARLAARQKKLDESSEQSPFSVIVGQVYDGPLDLLLDLIRKQDIDIYDIPIATITAQFLTYVNQLKASDVDVAGEFIYTASLLIHIKSKMLLPRSGTGPEEAAEDPRRELVERLLEHERFKNAAQMLQQKQMLEAATWSNPGAREFKDDEAAEPEIAADTVDLVRIFRDILERARKRPVLDVSEDSVTVGQMIQFLGRRLAMEDKPVALRRLLSHTRSERALIAMFLALLELVRMQAILLRQDRQFSEIFIKKHTGFDAVMSEGLMNAHDDWR
jgi:segregation and condensation protein A